MKKTIWVVFATTALLELSCLNYSKAGDIVYNADLVNDSVISIDTNYDLNLRIPGISNLSFVVSYSTSAPTSKTFTDGRASTATITVSSNSALSLAKLVVHTVRLDENNQWTKTTTASGTAKSISDAIMANSTLNAIITSTWSAAGVVTATSNVVGVNAYVLFTSTNSGLRLNGSSVNSTDTFLNGADSNIDLSTDLITVTQHGYNTGFGVWFATSGYTTPTGLSNGTTYYVIKNDYDRIKLASSKANATAGTGINITAQNGGGTFTLNPIPISGNPSFKWQASNDGISFVDLSVSSVTITGTSASVWDFGSIPYQILRLKYASPTFGGATIKASGTGRR